MHGGTVKLPLLQVAGWVVGGRSAKDPGQAEVERAAYPPWISMAVPPPTGSPGKCPLENYLRGSIVLPPVDRRYRRVDRASSSEAARKSGSRWTDDRRTTGPTPSAGCC